MNYINTKTKEYPLTREDITKLHPNTSFPLNYDFSKMGYAPIYPPQEDSFLGDKKTYNIAYTLVKAPAYYNPITRKYHENYTYVSKFEGLSDVNITITLAAIKKQLKANIAAIRYTHQNAGIQILDYTNKENIKYEVVDGKTVETVMPVVTRVIRTDDDFIISLVNKYTLLKNKILLNTYWKWDTNDWELLTLKTITPVVEMVSQYVEDCFYTEKNHLDLIESLDENTVLTYDPNSNWPKNIIVKE